MRRTASVCALALLAAGLGVRTMPSGAAAAPAPEDVVRHVVAAQTAAGVASADAELRLRVHKAATDPPDCVFTGTMRVEGGRQSILIQRRSAGLGCSAAAHYALGRLFEAQEPLESFLARFDLTILGEKLVGGDHYYLIQGTARDPKGNPHGLTMWIDDDRGVIPEGTLNYAWGDVDVEQTYARLNDAWVMTRQFLYTRRFDASLEIDYRNFSFTHALGRIAPARGGDE